MKTFKKFLSVLLCAVMLFSVVAIGASAANATSVYVNGISLSNGKYLASGATAASSSKPASNKYAYFKDGVLTLNDYTFKAGDGSYNYDSYSPNYSARIYAAGDLTIKFFGNNGLVWSKDADYCGENDIYVKGNLNFVGAPDAALSLSGFLRSAYAKGKIVSSGGTYNLRRGFANSDFGNDITFNGGTYNVTYDCITTEDDLIINGGTFNLNGFNAAKASDIIINGGTINANVRGGFIAESSISVYGGNITVASSNGYAFQGQDFGTLVTDGYIKASASEAVFYDSTVNGYVLSVATISTDLTTKASLNSDGSSAGTVDYSKLANYKWLEIKGNTYNVSASNATVSSTKAYYGETVNAQANLIAGKEFVNWTVSGVTLEDNTASSISFEMPKSAVTLTANYKDGASAPATGKNITVINGTAAASKAVAGTIVEIKAEQIDGKKFSHWEITGATAADKNAKETSFTMGSSDVTAEAVYDDCDCKCHQGGIAGFFYKIVLFFQKLFGQNKICEGCGAAH